MVYSKAVNTNYIHGSNELDLTGCFSCCIIKSVVLPSDNVTDSNPVNTTTTYAAAILENWGLNHYGIVAKS